MIPLRKSIAKVAVSNAIASGRVNSNSGAKAYLLQTNIHVNRIYNAKDTKFMNMSLLKYTEKEVAAADAMLWLIAYIEKLNCQDIEKLLKDVAQFRATHPDKPVGQWPYEK